MALAISTVASADVLYLNNGNKVEGTITEQNDTYITIRTNNGKELTYKKLEVRGINDEGAVNMPSESTQREYIDFSRRKTGWWCAVELTGNFDPTKFIDTEDKAQYMGNLELSFTNGYRFNPYFRIGVGVGVRYNFNYKEMGLAMGKEVKSFAFPLFLDLRGNIISQEYHTVVPYWSLDAGYAFHQGAFVEPTFGIRIGDLRNNVLVGLSYMGQHYGKLDGQFRSSISLKVGYEF